jgi:hypothetical protein
MSNINTIRYSVRYVNGPSFANINWSTTQSCDNDNNSGVITLTKGEWKDILDDSINIDTYPDCNISFNTFFQSNPSISCFSNVCVSPIALNPGASFIFLPTGSNQVTLSGSIVGNYSNLLWTYISSSKTTLTKTSTSFLTMSFSPQTKLELFEETLLPNLPVSFSISEVGVPFEGVVWKQLAGASQLSYYNNNTSSLVLIASASIEGDYVVESDQSFTYPIYTDITQSYAGSSFSSSIVSSPQSTSIIVLQSQSFGENGYRFSATASDPGTYIVKVVETSTYCYFPTASVLYADSITPTFVFSQSGQYSYNMCVQNQCGDYVCVPFSIDVPTINYLPDFTIGSGFNNTVRDILYYSDPNGFLQDIYVVGDFTNYNGSLVKGIVRLKNDGYIQDGWASYNGFSGSGIPSQLQPTIDSNGVLVGTSEINNGFQSGSFGYNNYTNHIFKINSYGVVETSSFNIDYNLDEGAINNRLFNFCSPKDQLIFSCQPRFTRFMDFYSNDVFTPYSSITANGVYTIDENRVMLTGTSYVPATGSIPNSGYVPSPITASIPNGAVIINTQTGYLDSRFTGFSGSNGSGVWKAAFDKNKNYAILQLHDWPCSEGNYYGSSWNGVSVGGLIKVNLTTGQMDSTFNIGTGSLQFGSLSSSDCPNHPWMDVLEVLNDDRVIFVVSQTGLNVNGTSITAGQPYVLDVSGSIDSLNLARFNGYVSCLKQLPDGRFLAGGTFTSYDGIPVNNFVRLDSTGNVDL